MKKLKILQINNHYSLRGGSEKVFLDTIKLLDENGHEVRFLASSPDINSVQRNEKGTLFPSHNKLNSNKNFIKKSIEFIYNPKTKKIFKNEVEIFKPDIIHLHIFYGTFSNSIIAEIKKLSIPTVMTIHEYRLICPAYKLLNGNGKICQSCKGRNYYNAIKHRCIKQNVKYSILAALECYIRDFFFSQVKNISHFIMVSDFVNEIHLKSLSGLESKTTRIYNFTETNQQDTKRDFNRIKIDLTYFGRISEEKGIETMIKAALETKLKLNIIGDGPLLNELMTKYNSELITFHGFKSGDQLNSLLDQTKYVVVPSEWYESLGMVILEAYSRKIPVIASKIGGIPEIVKEDETGYLFKPKDVEDLKRAMNKAMNLKPLDYQNLSENCFKFVHEQFNSSIHFMQLNSLYNQLLRNKN